MVINTTWWSWCKLGTPHFHGKNVMTTNHESTSFVPTQVAGNTLEIKSLNTSIRSFRWSLSLHFEMQFALNKKLIQLLSPSETSGPISGDTPRPWVFFLWKKWQLHLGLSIIQLEAQHATRTKGLREHKSIRHQVVSYNSPTELLWNMSFWTSFQDTEDDSF